MIYELWTYRYPVSLGVWTSVEGAQRFAASRDVTNGEDVPTIWFQSVDGSWVGREQGGTTHRYVIMKVEVNE